jgi:hypothetical protein
MRFIPNKQNALPALRGRSALRHRVLVRGCKRKPACAPAADAPSFVRAVKGDALVMGKHLVVDYALAI